jgi:prepilin-type N-terminal cleavage/methylation domain-containing protein
MGSLSAYFKKSGGFTLLELLVVVSILAVLAGSVLTTYRGVNDHAAEKVALDEMRELKKALLQFRQDTGYLPKQGLFDLSSAGCTAPATPADARFCSPANLEQLYEEPVDSLGDPIFPWSVDTGRGWRGPYIERVGEGLVDIGEGLSEAGAGSPIAGDELQEIRAVADPFINDAVTAGGSELFEWRSSPGAPPEDTRTRFGRPYLVFDLDDGVFARIVSLGPNGRYDCDRDGDGDCDADDVDGTTYDLCVPPTGSDDRILCLLQ